MAKKESKNSLEGDPLWYKDAIIYEIHVRAFRDSNSDGMGDFRGLGEKLDYLEELGVTAIWLLPFFPSPWRDDGYDISDFRSVHPSYGNVRDFQAFLKEAHRRGIRVITEMVINHTSDQHDWFQRSRRAAPGSRWRDFYVWSDTPNKYNETRIIFKDFESSNWSWDPVARAYFWHRFYSHQPDLNFDNPLVQRAVFRAIDFWADMGVDGFRLDAIPYLYEREGTSCENLPETHQFLKDLRRHIDSKYPDRMLLAEANMWPEDAIAYFQDGNECHMAFHFPLMPRLFMALRLEDRFPIIEILRRTPPIPETCQWALFLRNHDELTLEMVTDEERDYMYRVYASDQRSRINLGIRRRLAPLLDNDRPRIELMNAMLFSLPGTPVLYYGDEIGMGDNIYLGDRNGVRTPMQWSPDRNAGFSAANPQQLYLPLNIDPAYHYEHVNVETQQSNPNSLLSWTKRLIALRKQYKAFGRGTLEFLQTSNHRVVAFVRRYEEETILVIANLSRFAQPVTLSLTEFHDLTPVEMFGRTDFPSITDAPYTLTLGPSSFYWFSMERRQVRKEIATGETLPAATHELPLVTAASLEAVWQGESREAIARLFARFAQTQSWYLGEDRNFRSSKILDIVTLAPSRYLLLFLQMAFTEGDPQIYSIPVSIQSEPNSCAVVRIKTGDTVRVLCDAANDRDCDALFLEMISRRKRIAGEKGSAGGQHNRWFRKTMASAPGAVEVKPTPSGERNTTVRYGDKFLLKLLRSVEPGEHPGVALSRLLTETYSFPNTAPFAGTLDYQSGASTSTIGVLHGYVENHGEVWNLTLDHLKDVYERMRQNLAKVPPRSPRIANGKIFSIDLALGPPSSDREDLLGAFKNQLEQIGATLAEMHALLARDSDDPAIAPEPYNDFYRQSLYHGMVRLFSRRAEFLRQHTSELSPQLREYISSILAKENDILGRFRLIYELRIQAVRTRYHGQMGLEHILYSDKGFTFIDFEGDPQLHLTQRSIKRTPLRDVASLLQSLAHALQISRVREITGARHASLDDAHLIDIGLEWYIQAVDAVQNGYWRVAERGAFLPPTHEQQQALLNVHLLERSLLDLRAFYYHQRDLFSVPLRIMLHLLGQS